MIDEHSTPTTKNDLAPSILEILETHKDAPFKIEDYWIDMATTIGYTNLTSSTAVRLEMAFNNPFPKERVAEDYHTWVRYSASGGFFYYSPSIPSLYRIPKNSDGSSSRTRAGGRTLFNVERAKVEEAGMYKAIEIFRKRKTIHEIEMKKIMMYFYFRLYKSFFAEGDYELADSQYKKAFSLLKDICLVFNCVS